MQRIQGTCELQRLPESALQVMGRAAAGPETLGEMGALEADFAVEDPRTAGVEVGRVFQGGKVLPMGGAGKVPCLVGPSRPQVDDLGSLGDRLDAK